MWIYDSMGLLHFQHQSNKASLRYVNCWIIEKPLFVILYVLDLFLLCFFLSVADIPDVY